MKIFIYTNSRKKNKKNFKKNYPNSRQINDKFGNSKKYIKLYFARYVKSNILIIKNNL